MRCHIQCTSCYAQDAVAQAKTGSNSFKTGFDSVYQARTGPDQAKTGSTLLQQGYFFFPY